MGSQLTAQPQNVIIDIKVERPTYFMQDIIKGMVNIVMKEKLNHQGVVYLKVLSNKNQFFKFKGQEFARKFIPGNQQKTKKNQRIAIKNNFINVQQVLYNFGKQLPVGSISFPFQIPINLQNVTFDGKQSNLFYCHIQYYIQVQINSIPMIKTPKNIKQRLPIIIVRDYYKIDRPIQTEELLQANQLCFKNLGQINCRLTSNKACYEVGSIALVEVDIDNSLCLENLSIVKLGFYGELRLKIAGKLKNYPILYSSKKCNSIKKGEIVNFNETLEIANVFNEPIKLQTSTESPNIEYHHYIKLSMSFNKCFHSKLEIRVPINVIKQSDLIKLEQFSYLPKFRQQQSFIIPDQDQTSILYREEIQSSMAQDSMVNSKMI